MNDQEKLQEMKTKMEKAVEQYLVLSGINPKSEERKRRCKQITFGDNPETIAFTIDSFPVVWMEITEKQDKTLDIGLYSVDSTLLNSLKSIN